MCPEQRGVFMKKMCIGLFGISICITTLNADGFHESDRELVGAKDFPFPPGQEGNLPEADDTSGTNNDSTSGSDNDDDDSYNSNPHPSQNSDSSSL
jgi:hypothetical protein